MYELNCRKEERKLKEEKKKDIMRKKEKDTVTIGIPG